FFPGSLYNEKYIDRTGKAIEEIPFLSEIKPVEVEFFESSADIFLYLKKKKANHFNALLGVLPNSEKTGKLLFTGEVDFHLLNSIGRGESIRFVWRKNESASQKLNIDLAYPFVLSSPIGLQYNLMIDKRDSSFLNVVNELGFNYFLGKGNYFSAFYRTMSSSTLLNNLSASDFADLNSNIFGIGFRFRRLDYLMNPRKGILLESRIAYGNKKLKNINQLNENDISNDILTQIEGMISVEKYFLIAQNFVLLLANHSEFINNSVLFENELLKIGGHNSLRGFDEESIVASAYTIFTLEFRYLFEQNSNVFIFADGAYYEKNTVSGFLSDTPFGFGLGSSFQTKAGIFTISYALGKQFDNPVEIKNAKIHFGIVNYF
ncbi:MAG: hypothetical protein U9R19_03485, partial [Bacteroidota bacterium]|nr:hypothetical protein [Bacteroidota bacterium]